MHLFGCIHALLLIILLTSEDLYWLKLADVTQLKLAAIADSNEGILGKNSQNLMGIDQFRDNNICAFFFSLAQLYTEQYVLVLHDTSFFTLSGKEGARKKWALSSKQQTLCRIK